MDLCTSFAPVINNSCKILILGSMPGIKSLTEQQYYAHPHNRFWPVMAALCNQPVPPAIYTAKLQMLLTNGFALWDVLQHCQRTGSLDSAITDEMPNDLPSLLGKYPNIKQLACNGNKAASSLKKHFPALFTDPALTISKLPSTSPANARWRIGELTDCWHQALLG